MMVLGLGESKVEAATSLISEAPRQARSVSLPCITLAKASYKGVGRWTPPRDGKNTSHTAKGPRHRKMRSIGGHYCNNQPQDVKIPL